MKEVTIYTDGSSLKNPGPSGCASVLIYEGKEKELQNGYKLSTNNRMELMAIIQALQALNQKCSVNLYTDSRYAIDGATKWMHGWIKRDWKDSKRNPVKNVDLWQEIAKLVNKHNINWHHVKAHSGVELNERCDKLAKKAAKEKNLNEDLGYKP